jgi:hypothetical protein
MNTIKKYYHEKWFIGLIILFSVMSIYALLEVKNHRFGLCDFEVYYKAGGRMLHGENLYRPIEDGFYHYKYSPVAAVYFIPFSVLSYTVAKIAYWLFLSSLVCLGFYLLLKILEPKFEQRTDHRLTNNFFLLAALILVVHIARELELGQVNHLLLVCYIGILWLLSNKRGIAAGIIAGASIFLKPFGLIFLPWLLLRREWKAAFSFFISGVFFAFVPVVFMGWGALSSQYAGWFQEMGIELSNKESMLADANHTIFSVLARYTPLQMTSLVIDHVFAYQLLVLAALGAIFLWSMYEGKLTRQSLLLEGALLISLIPLLSFTSYNAFGFVEASVFLLLYYFKKLTPIQKTLAIAGMVLTGGNIYELFGRNLWLRFENWSFVAIGAILLLITLVLVRKRHLC